MPIRPTEAVVGYNVSTSKWMSHDPFWLVLQPDASVSDFYRQLEKHGIADAEQYMIQHGSAVDPAQTIKLRSIAGATSQIQAVKLWHRQKPE